MLRRTTTGRAFELAVACPDGTASPSASMRRDRGAVLSGENRS